MAVAGRYTRFGFDEFDFSGESNSLSVSLTVAALTSTGFQAGAETFVPGLSTGVISQGGHYSGNGAADMYPAMRARLGTATPVYVYAMFGTNVAGCYAFVTAQSWGKQLTIDAPIADLITLKSEWPSSGQLIHGKRLTSVATQTISGIGALAAVDFGAAGAAGGMAYLFVQSIVGAATGATVTIESSATEGGVYAVEGTFTFSAVGTQVVTMTGTVNRWIRLNVTGLGGSTSFVVLGIGGIAGVSY